MRKPDTVIIAPPLDLVASMDFRDLRELVLFITKAMRANGIQAILVSAPVDGKLPRKQLRDYALMLKELGRSFDIPVIDLYSSSLRQGHVGKFWE